MVPPRPYSKTERGGDPFGSEWGSPGSRGLVLVLIVAEMTVLWIAPTVGAAWWVIAILIVGLPVFAIVAALTVRWWRDHGGWRRVEPDI